MILHVMLGTSPTFSPCSSAMFIFFSSYSSFGKVLWWNRMFISCPDIKKVNKIPLVAAEKCFFNLSWATKIKMSYPIHEDLNANFLLFCPRNLQIKKCKNQSPSTSINLPKSHYIFMYIQYITQSKILQCKHNYVGLYLCMHIEWYCTLKKKKVYRGVKELVICFVNVFSLCIYCSLKSGICLTFCFQSAIKCLFEFSDWISRNMFTNKFLWEHQGHLQPNLIL